MTGALWTVVIEVMTPGITEVRIAEFVEVHRMVNPLRDNVALDIAGEHDGQSVNWKQKTQRSRDQKQRQQIFEVSIDVLSIKRIRVMAGVHGVEDLVQIVLNTRLVLEVNVEKPAVCDVLD